MNPSEPVTGLARLTLEITVDTQRGPVATTYALRRLDPDPRVAHPAWRLTKMGGTASEFYDVSVQAHGPECTCGDYNFRRRNEKLACKHVRALEAIGLLGE